MGEYTKTNELLKEAAKAIRDDDPVFARHILIDLKLEGKMNAAQKRTWKEIDGRVRKVENKRGLRGMSNELSTFVRSYLETALWSSVGEDDEPLDRDFTITDFSDDAVRKAVKDCEKFQDENATDLAIADEEYGQDDSRAGHDFWLTRNRHGAGFWDGDYGDELGERLTDAAQKFGEVFLYAGDSGEVEME